MFVVDDQLEDTMPQPLTHPSSHVRVLEAHTSLASEAPTLPKLSPPARLASDKQSLHATRAAMRQQEAMLEDLYFRMALHKNQADFDSLSYQRRLRALQGKPQP